MELKEIIAAARAALILGGDSQPLDIGRAERTAPPRHAVHRVDSGEKSLANMVLLCPGQHRIVHSQQWDVDLSCERPMFIPPPVVDPLRRPRPGNRPLHQLALAPLIVA